MPGGDGTGPRGYGSGTGWGLGPCGGGMRRGFGRGFGQRRFGFVPRQLSQEFDDKQLLQQKIASIEEEEQYLKQEKELLQKRMAEQA